MNARLWAAKDDLRKLEGALRECLLAAQQENIEIPAQEYLSLAVALEERVQNDKQDIEALEKDRSRIQRLIAQFQK